MGINRAKQSIYDYLENYADECQCTMEDLMNQITGTYQPDVKTIKARHIAQYEDDILITKDNNKKNAFQDWRIEDFDKRMVSANMQI